jgi:pimeloyl-ACP methyl ester carboxylesterase
MTFASIRRALTIIGIALLIFGGWIATLRAGWWSDDYATLRARYGGPPSQFITIDGTELHVRDEGSGPVVVLLHGSIVSLREWDPVVERLKSRYRLVRFDWPPYGLSQPDPRNEYSTARDVALLQGLVEHMGLDQFTLVATSNGGNIALEYAAQHPERVRALALSVLPIERPSQTRAVDARIRALDWFHQRFLPDYHSKYWFRLILEDTTPAGFVPPQILIDTMHDFNNLPGAAQRQRTYIASNTKLFKTTDVGAVASRITAPVLLQWCEQDTVISQSADRTIARFTQAPVTLVRYPQFGHFPMWEDPDLFTADLGKFLDKVNQP